MFVNILLHRKSFIACLPISIRFVLFDKIDETFHDHKKCAEIIYIFNSLTELLVVGEMQAMMLNATYQVNFGRDHRDIASFWCTVKTADH